MATAVTQKPLTYADAGVSIAAGNALVKTIGPLARSTARPGADAELGGFGGFFDLKAAGFLDPLLVAANDGVGTKLKLAIEVGRHDGVGIDLVAMCVNDLIVQGAEPLFFLDYFATGRLDNGIAERVIAGIAEGCRIAGCALIGGETAEMPGFYGDDDYDVAGFILGVVDAKNLIDGKAVREGDILVGLPSAGLHTNGYSLARRVLFDKLGYDHQSIIPDIGKAGEVLLAPHLSYLKPLLPLVEQRAIHAMAHITGGGLTDNVPRVLPETLDAHIKLGSWPVLPIFQLIYEKGGVEGDEMLRVFNMGIGMVLILAPEEVDRVSKRFLEIGQKFYFIGNVVKGSGRVVYDKPPSGFASWIE